MGLSAKLCYGQNQLGELGCAVARENQAYHNRYLGVIASSDVIWSPHISTVPAKGRSYCIQDLRSIMYVNAVQITASS